MSDLPVTGSTRPARGLVVFGDSVAEGWNDPDPAGGWLGWAGRLAGNLGLSRADEVHNVAVPGATVADVVSGQLPLVAHLRPALVMLSCGMNDVLNGFERAELVRCLHEIFRWGRGTGAAVFAACVTAPPLMEQPIISEFRKKRMRQRIADLNAELSLHAHAFGVTFIGPDLVPRVTERELWSPDGIHFNPAGHAYVAEVITEITRTALYSRRDEDPPACPRHEEYASTALREQSLSSSG